MRARYGLLLMATTVLLTAGALYSFVQIGAATGRSVAPTATWLSEPVPLDTTTLPVVPESADYARYAEEDRAWREAHARQYTLAEIRARGDGRRTARQAMQDRVFTFVRAGQRPRAISELERWVGGHPTDADALLWLARLLNEAGRTDDSIRRYRQLIALQDER